jgi:hypothetical protein
VRLENPPITRTIGRIQRAGRTLSPAAQAFVDMLMHAGREKSR